jgi:hypothetical protein
MVQCHDVRAIELSLIGELLLILEKSPTGFALHGSFMSWSLPLLWGREGLRESKTLQNRRVETLHESRVLTICDLRVYRRQCQLGFWPAAGF